MKDITGTEDVKLFVDQFYARIQKDELLAPIFEKRVAEKGWEVHLNTMYDFWNSVLFFERTYKGRPFARHIGLPIAEEHFKRWLSLFHETIDTNFRGEKAEEVKLRSAKMALMFQTKMAYIRSSNIKPIL